MAHGTHGAHGKESGVWTEQGRDRMGRIYRMDSEPGGQWLNPLVSWLLRADTIRTKQEGWEDREGSRPEPSRSPRPSCSSLLTGPETPTPRASSVSV